jgi:hypothetical protein
MTLRWAIFTSLFLCGVNVALAVNPNIPTVTNNVTEAKAQGERLAQRLRELQPAQAFTNEATLRIQSKKRRVEVPLHIVTTVTPTNWQASYVAETTNGIHSFAVSHAADRPNEYRIEPSDGKDRDRLMSPLAESDFWIIDLGGEFFHWPTQMLWKKEMKNSQACDVMESKPAVVMTNGYSRIVSWVDQDTGGIVQAEAYDANGKRLKEFEVKEARKVNGEWRVTELEIRNVQTRSTTLLIFHYDH